MSPGGQGHLQGPLLGAEGGERNAVVVPEETAQLWAKIVPDLTHLESETSGACQSGTAPLSQLHFYNFMYKA